MAPGVQPGTNNQAWYKQQLNESGLAYDPNNLPPLRNSRVRSGYHDTADFKRYELLCQAKSLDSREVSP